VRHRSHAQHWAGRAGCAEDRPVLVLRSLDHEQNTPPTLALSVYPCPLYRLFR
jgi:hypothetical protein